MTICSHALKKNLLPFIYNKITDIEACYSRSACYVWIEKGVFTDDRFTVVNHRPGTVKQESIPAGLVMAIFISDNPPQPKYA